MIPTAASSSKLNGVARTGVTAETGDKGPPRFTLKPAVRKGGKSRTGGPKKNSAKAGNVWTNGKADVFPNNQSQPIEPGSAARVIRPSPDISADARYYASLIFIVTNSLRPIAAINYARRANYVRSTNDSRRRNDMPNMNHASGKLHRISFKIQVSSLTVYNQTCHKRYRFKCSHN